MKEQRFAKIKKKELIDVYYVNANETEVLLFAIYKVRRSRGKRYFLEIHRYKNGLYNRYNWETIYHEINMVGYTIGEAVQALRQAIQEYANDVVLDSVWATEKLRRKAGITNLFEEKPDERLNKLLTFSDRAN